MRRLFEVTDDLTGNLPPMPAVFPDMLAPVVRVADGVRRLEPMRWGMPGPPQFGGAPITNIRNTSSLLWRRLYLVQVTSSSGRRPSLGFDLARSRRMLRCKPEGCRSAG